MDEEVPVWLNHAFLSSALQSRDDQGNVSIIQFSCSPAVSAGNNYMSNLYRVKIYYKQESKHETQSTSLIVKAPLTKGEHADMFEAMGILTVEPKMYNEILPKFESKVNSKFSPKSLHSSVKNVLVLEDLREDGFVMLDKYKKLDFAQCKCVITNIAKYHAASVACHNEDPNLIESIGQERLFMDGESFSEKTKHWLENSVELAAGALKEIDGCDELSELILSIRSHIMQTVVKITKPKPKGLNVLNHGDLWNNNVLFKCKESSEPNEIRFIDFQLPRYGSPVIDLLFFIWTSANETVLDNKQQDLLEIYLEVLNSTLDQLKCEERLTMDELRQDLLWAKDWIPYVISAELPLMMNDSEDSSNDIQFNFADALSKTHGKKYYRALLPVIVKQFKDWCTNQI